MVQSQGSLYGGQSGIGTVRFPPASCQCTEEATFSYLLRGARM